MAHSHKLSAAIKQAIIGSAGAAALMSGVNLTYAQEDTVLEEMTVTGSRIKRADLDSPSPVTVLDRSDIKITGLTDVGDFIQSMPAMSGSPIGTTTNNGGDGSVRINLRGLGDDRTLTLINGRRTVDRGDYQAIPAAMIERVEILKNGASAVYGADAVAGVVNIITRKDYEGLELEVQTNDFFDIDSGSQDSVSLVTGKSFDGGHVVVGAEYVTQEETFQSDTPWDFMQNSYYIYPEGCEARLTNPYDGTANTGCFPIGSSRIPEGRFRFASQGLFLNGGDGLIPHDGRTYNYAPVNYIQTPYERTNFFLDSEFDIAENVKAFAEVRANIRQSAQELAPLPYDGRPGNDPAFDGFYVDGEGVIQPYSGISPENFYLIEAATAAGLTPEPVIDIRRRMVETNRRFTQDVTQVSLALGLDGDFNGINWNLTYNRGDRNEVFEDFGQFSGAALALALGPSADLNGDGSPQCYDTVNGERVAIEGCVPLNLFGGPNTVTQEMLDYVSVDLTDHLAVDLETLDLSFAGEAFELPGGALGWAAGIGYIGESFTLALDSGKQQGAVTGNKALGTSGSLHTTSVYGELFAPVLQVGEQSLDFTLGLRWDDYSEFDAESTWQLGVEYTIYDDLKLRASTGTVFRTPQIEDLFGGLSDSFPTFTDPCAGDPLPAGCDRTSVQTDTQVLRRVGGNEEVGPETGETFSLGLVFTPEIAGGDLSVTLDYWETEFEDGISTLGAQFILDQCYIELDDSTCGLVTRRPDYSVQQIIDETRNLSEQTAAGVDTEIRYIKDTDFGQIRGSFLWAHMLERTRTPFEGAPKEKLEGRYTDPTADDGGAYAEDKFNYQVTLLRDSFSVSYRGEFISGMDADTFCNCGPSGTYIQDIDSVLYHDLTGTYTLPFGTTIGAGVTNLTDEEPPFIEVGFNATTDPATYRLFGRGYYLRLTHEF